MNDLQRQTFVSRVLVVKLLKNRDKNTCRSKGRNDILISFRVRILFDADDRASLLKSSSEHAVKNKNS